jgi:hypothetical protein
MGCNCSREEARVIVNSQINGRNRYFVKVSMPNSEKIKVVTYEGKADYMLLADLMNHLFFNSRYAEEMDANFISVFDKKKEEFEYFIQRLAGFEIEREDEPYKGRMWVPYINRQKYSWSVLCGKNRVVKKEDEIEFRYENYVED